MFYASGYGLNMTMSHNILRHSLIMTLSTITYYVSLNGLVLK